MQYGDKENAITLFFFWNVQDIRKGFVFIINIVISMMLKRQTPNNVHLRLWVHQDVDFALSSLLCTIRTLEISIGVLGLGLPLGADNRGDKCRRAGFLTFFLNSVIIILFSA